MPREKVDGSITVLIDQFLGKRLNSCKDVVVQPKGLFWSADPAYGIVKNYEGLRGILWIGPNLPV